MTTKVMPAIREKWPVQPGLGEKVKVKIIHDNAKPHFEDGDSEAWTAVSETPQFEATLVQQPSQSPDRNILDLGFFNGLQKLQFRSGPASNIDELIERVETAFSEYDPVILNRVFLTHMMVMEQIILHDGGNHFALPHMGKK